MAQCYSTVEETGQDLDFRDLYGILKEFHAVSEESEHTIGRYQITRNIKAYINILIVSITMELFYLKKLLEHRGDNDSPVRCNEIQHTFSYARICKKEHFSNVLLRLCVVKS